jgi:hypothetical protein
MPRALNLIRKALPYRREAFSQGLQAAGFEVFDDEFAPSCGDAVVIWNRYGTFDAVATKFEKVGAYVFVAENGLMGDDWLPGKWFSLALSHVAIGGGEFKPAGVKRWGDFGIPLKPYTYRSDPPLILEQRSIGHPTVASPHNWAASVQARFGGVIRKHPGTQADPVGQTLMDGLNRAGSVITWCSGAAVKAMAYGLPVWYRHEKFVMASACRPLAGFTTSSPLRDYELRIQAFQKMAWAIWELEEIRSGFPFSRLMA